jgi:photosystem II stability/assembly factor-like uncharacterized protein
MRRAIHYLILVVLLASSADAQVIWEHPNGISGGQIEHIAAGPDNTLYVLGYEGRVYRSTDGGGTWTETLHANDPKDVEFITQPMSLFVASSGTVFAVYLNFIMRSDDAGLTWTKPLEAGYFTVAGQRPSLSAITEAPGGKIIAVASQNVGNEYRNELLVSGDDGVTWQNIESPQLSTMHYLYSITVDENGSIYLVATKTGAIWRSTDGGVTWENRGSYRWSGNHEWFGYAISRVKVLNDGSLITVMSSSNLGGVMYSTDKGATWVNTSAAGPVLDQYDVDPDGNIMYILRGYSDVLRTKRGDDFYTVTPPDAGKARRIYADKNGTFYLGTENGLFATTDLGDHWTEISIPNLGVSGLTRTNSGSIIAGSSLLPGRLHRYGEGSVMRSTDNGASWARVGSQAGLKRIAAGPEGSVMMSSNARLYVSSDDGLTWEKRTSLIGGLTDEWLSVSTLALGHSDRIFASMGEFGLFISSDAGETWDRAVSNQAFSSYALAIDSDGVVYTGDSLQMGPSSKLYRSSDNGVTWTELPSIVDGHGIRSLAARGNIDLFAAVDNVGVFKSQDQGVSWTPIGSGLPAISYSSLHINDNGRVLLATNEGVFVLNETDSEWEAINADLYNLDVFVLATTADGRLIAGTESGATRTSNAIPPTPASNTDDPTADERVRMALANDVTGGGFSVSLDLKEELSGRIEVFDLLGKLVFDIPARAYATGRHRLHIGTELAKGSYFVRFVSGETIVHSCIGNLW